MEAPVRTYLVVTFLLTWAAILGPYLAFRLGWLSWVGLNLWFNLGALGPSVGALVAARWHYGPAGLAVLEQHLRRGPASARTWLLTLSPLALLGLGLVLYPLLTGHAYSFAITRQQFELTTPLHYAAWALPFLSYGLLEEVGWRGFLLPHLQQRHPGLLATVLLTAAWGSWHAPMFLFRMQFSPLLTIGFFLSLLVGALLLTAVFNATRGGVLATMLFHLANNLASALDKHYLVVVAGASYVLLALYLLRRYGPQALAPAPRVGNYFAAARASTTASALNPHYS